MKIGRVTGVLLISALLVGCTGDKGDIIDEASSYGIVEEESAEEYTYRPTITEGNTVRTVLSGVELEITLPKERIVADTGGFYTAFTDDYMVMAYYLDSNIPVGNNQAVEQWREDFCSIVPQDSYKYGDIENGYYCYGYDTEGEAYVMSIIQDMGLSTYLHIFVTDLTTTCTCEQLLNDWMIKDIQ